MQCESENLQLILQVFLHSNKAKMRKYLGCVGVFLALNVMTMPNQKWLKNL